MSHQREPTVVGVANFNAAEDAATLRGVMNIFGTEVQTIFDIVSTRSDAQRQAIAEAYTHEYGRDIVEDLQTELGDHLLGHVIVALMRPPGCKVLYNFMDGPGKRIKAEIAEIVDTYERLKEWRWQPTPESCGPHWVTLDEHQQQVTFHPRGSAGTAVVRGDHAFCHDHHYYWEVKMLTDTYENMTDIMVGVGTDKVSTTGFRYKFITLLGEDEQSYGLSHRGMVRHAGRRAGSGPGFCRGTLVGVRVDMWQGTLEFYLNRKPQGICYYDLRRHQQLYPMVCSTMGQSSVRLTYAASWRASLLVDAAKILAESARRAPDYLPPGLGKVFATHFWLLLPTEGLLSISCGALLHQQRGLEAQPLAPQPPQAPNVLVAGMWQAPSAPYRSRRRARLVIAVPQRGRGRCRGSKKGSSSEDVEVGETAGAPGMVGVRYVQRLFSIS